MICLMTVLKVVVKSVRYMTTHFMTTLNYDEILIPVVATIKDYLYKTCSLLYLIKRVGWESFITRYFYLDHWK